MRREKKIVKCNEDSLDRVARLGLATVLLPAGLVWLGGWQGNGGGLFAASIGGLALFTGLTGIGPSCIRVWISKSEKKQSAAPSIANAKS